MIVFRPVTIDDIDDVFALSEESSGGLTTLPTSRDFLTKRIERSVADFKRDVNEPGDEIYFFVLEDTQLKKVIGTAAIEAAAGIDGPFYTYKLGHNVRMSRELNIRKDYKSLFLSNDYQGKSEMCTLFLSEPYRRDGNGVLLSRARMMFLAEQPNRFTDIIFAEMRGFVDENGQSPFWESLGRHFFNMDFQQADHYSAVTNKQFISDLMPRQTIYVSLLSQAAQDAIGRPHDAAKPAMKILQKEGFRYREYVDIFDGGPTIEAVTQDIKTVRESRVVTLESIEPVETDERKKIVATRNVDIRVCLANIRVHGDACVIDETAARTLGVNVGDSLRIA